MSNDLSFDFNAEHNWIQCVKQDAIRLFKNDLGFKVRVVMREDGPWFVAKDLATCIEHSNVTKMCELCRDKDKIVVSIDDLKTNDLLVLGNRGLTCVSESGLYRILAKCNLTKCEPFESWVFDEVLPSIRKTGSYSIVQTQPTIYDYARALIAEKERSDALEAQNKALEAERDEAVRTKTQYQSGLASEMSGRVGGLTKANNALRSENEGLREENETLKIENGELKGEYVMNPTFAKELIAQGVVTIKFETLSPKTSKALQHLSFIMERPRIERKIFSDSAGKEVPQYWYNREVCDELKSRMIDNPKYLNALIKELKTFN